MSASLGHSSVQQSNFAILSRVRDDARRDPITASFRWGIPMSILERVGQMSPERLVELVSSLGEEAVFVLRADFSEILDLPSDVARVWAAATARRPAGTPSPQRRAGA